MTETGYPGLGPVQQPLRRLRPYSLIEVKAHQPGKWSHLFVLEAPKCLPAKVGYYSTGIMHFEEKENLKTRFTAEMKERERLAGGLSTASIPAYSNEYLPPRYTDNLFPSIF
jgi:hypothetical protein